MLLPICKYFVAKVPAGWKEKIATIEMNSVKASINEDRKTWGLSCHDNYEDEEDKEEANCDHDNDYDFDGDDNDNDDDNTGLCRGWAKWNMTRAQSPRR